MRNKRQTWKQCIEAVEKAGEEMAHCKDYPYATGSLMVLLADAISQLPPKSQAEFMTRLDRLPRVHDYVKDAQEYRAKKLSPFPALPGRDDLVQSVDIIGDR